MACPYEGPSRQQLALAGQANITITGETLDARKN